MVLIAKIVYFKFLSFFNNSKNSYLWRKKNLHNYTTYGGNFDINIVKVGEKTYGEITAYQYNNVNEFLLIGNYCSIAGNVKFILGGSHTLNVESTFPVKHFSSKGLLNDSFSNGQIVVNDHVWIGFGSTILSGVSIGRGSVVAAGAVVVNDVEPFTLVGGVPAKKIKDLKFFTEEQVKDYIDKYFDD